MSEHGTIHRYTNEGCRCDPCKQAWSNYARKRRAERIQLPIPNTVEHGHNSTYINYFCRCRPCRDAHNAYHRAYRKRVKQ